MSNPNLNKLPHVTGVANAQPITFLAGAAEFASTRFVTLSSNYTRTIPPGYPDPNPGINIKTSPTATPQTILAGMRVQLHSAEAAALVSANAAVFS